LLNFIAVGAERMEPRYRDNVDIFPVQPGEKLLIVDLDGMNENVATRNSPYLLQAIGPYKGLRQKQRGIINNTRIGCGYQRRIPETKATRGVRARESVMLTTFELSRIPH